MHIQWYPGHMTKALRMMEENVKLVDVVVYILDSRIPYSCINPKFTELIKNKKVIYVLNKSDLANKAETAKWIEYFKSLGNYAIEINSTKTNASLKIKRLILDITRDIIEKYKKKGALRIIRAMVIGVPNVGKSTLINNFAGKSRALTGDKPGVTKAKQWVKLDETLELLDTPGTLYPAFENQKIARHLAYVFSIREEIIDINELALEFLKEIVLIDETAIKTRYNIDNLSVNPLENLELIARKRGCIIRGGEVDYEKTSKLILDDFRKCKLGYITLERAGETVE